MNPYVFARETVERANAGISVADGGRISAADARGRLKAVEDAFVLARSRGEEFFEAFQRTFFDGGDDRHEIPPSA